MSRRTLIITGAEGQLGQSFREIHNESLYYRGVFDLILLDSKTLDITDLAQVDKVLSSLATPDSILVNCAAYTDVVGAESHRDECFRVNVTGVENLIQICEKLEVPLVHYSTNYVFNGVSLKAYTDKDRCYAPLGVYGESKMYSESALFSSSLDWKCIRTSWVVSHYKESFIEKIVKKVMAGENLQLTPLVMSRVTLAKDLASQTLKLILSNASKGVYHMATSRPHTLLALVHMICSELDKRVTYDFYEAPAIIPPMAVLRQSSGFSTPEDTGLKKYIREIAARYERN